MTMLVMLGVLYLLISLAREPSTWTWLTGERTPAGPEEQAEKEAADDKTASPAELAKAPPVEVIEAGPTDEDPEQQDAIQEEFQAIADRTLRLPEEEMHAYWRLFYWTQHQSLGQMNERALARAKQRHQEVPVLNQFMQYPDEERGKLVALNLNVRRILPYDAPANPAGVEKVYEVWGFTEESRAWLYVGVTEHLPPGMPTGPNVQERATFVGYFLKLQGYHEAGAKPNDRPLAAPLLVGRLGWKQSQFVKPSQSKDPPWMLWLLAAVAVLGIGRLMLPLAMPKRPRRGEIESPKSAASGEGVSVEEWLSQAEQGELPGIDEGSQDGKMDKPPRPRFFE